MNRFVLSAPAVLKDRSQLTFDCSCRIPTWMATYMTLRCARSMRMGAEWSVFAQMLPRRRTSNALDKVWLLCCHALMLSSNC